MSLNQMAPIVRIESEHFAADAKVVELDGTEEIHALFRFDLVLTLPHAQGNDPAAVIGTKIGIVIDDDLGDGRVQELRRIYGLVTACREVQWHDTSTVYRITVHPRLWQSTLVETLDIFQEMSVPDIIKKKLEALHLVDGTDFEFRLDGDYPKREFTVQYQETDFAFISRLCEHLGISFFFTATEDVDKVIFTDAQWGFSPIEGEEVTYRGRGGTRGVHEVIRQAQVVPSNFIQRDYNYRNPGADLLAQDSFDGFGGGIIEYGGHFKDENEGKALAVIRRQEHECRQLTFQGQAGEPIVCAGGRMKITDYPSGDFEVVPFRVHHRSVQSGFGDIPAEAYQTTFEAIPAEKMFRPLRLTPRPRVKGVLTGIIDSAGPGEYADVDDMGRYRVRFMFDTSGPDEGKASRPVRMMQPHSGSGYGMHFPLRRGVEVLITFIDGDPDRPIIAGTVPNPQSPSPVASSNARRNVLRTGAGNEMNIDDTKGSERIKFTVPHGSTIFQLGAPNLAESGAALQTTGAWTASATAGANLMTSIQTSMTAWNEWRSSGNIISKAEKPDWKKTALAGADVIKAGLAILSGALQTARLTADAVDMSYKQGAVAEQDKATKQYDGCQACQTALQAKEAALPANLQTQAQTARQARDEAVKAYGDSMNKRRVADLARDANIGNWNDLNEVGNRARLDAANQSYRDARDDAHNKLNNADTQFTNLETSLTNARDSASPADQAAIDDYLATLRGCNGSSPPADGAPGPCNGLAAAQETANGYHEGYYGIRESIGNSGLYKFAGQADKVIGAASAAINTVTTLCSTIMAIAAQLAQSTAQVKLTAKWAALSKAVEAGADGGRNRVSTKRPASASLSMHSLGATGSTELYGEDDVLVHGPKVGIYGSGKGDVTIGAGNCSAVTATKHVYLTAGNKVITTGDVLDFYAKNGKGEVILKAEKKVSIIAEKEDIIVEAKAASKEVKVQAGGGKTDPKLSLKSDGSGTVKLSTKEWEVLGDNKGFFLGQKGKGEIELRDDKVFIKKEGSTMTLEKAKTELKSDEVKIDGAGAFLHLKSGYAQIKPGASFGISKKNVSFRSVAKFFVDGKKIDLG